MLRNSDPNDPEQCLEIGLTKPQFRLVTTTSQFPAMVAGFGAGKTNALMKRCLMLKSQATTSRLIEGYVWLHVMNGGRALYGNERVAGRRSSL
jgi:hypothetical protein